jgi:hypothetical protein
MPSTSGVDQQVFAARRLDAVIGLTHQLREGVRSAVANHDLTVNGSLPDEVMKAAMRAYRDREVTFDRLMAALAILAPGLEPTAHAAQEAVRALELRSMSLDRAEQREWYAANLASIKSSVDNFESTARTSFGS